MNLFPIDDILFSLKWIKDDADIDEVSTVFLQGVIDKYRQDATESIEAYNRCIEICTIRLDSNPADLKALEHRAAALFRTDRFDEAISDFKRVVELNPQNPDIYQERARYYQRKRNYPSAIVDYTNAIDFSTVDNGRYYNARAQCYVEMDKLNEALDDYSRSIEIKPNAESYLGRGKIRSAFASDKAIEDFTKAIELYPDGKEAYLLRGELFEKKGQYDLAEKDYNKAIEIDPEYASALYSRANLYHYALNRYDDAIENYDKTISTCCLDDTGDNISYDSNEIYEEIIEANKKLIQHQAELENQLKEETIREEERKKIIADLSHSIKNLISTVIDPLENLKQETSVKPQVIENALRGANLIREIVNALNLSFKGSIEDFRYDTAHNTDSDSQDVKAIITAALKHSVGNMFDGKYFGIFMRKYFPEKSLYLAAKAEWSTLSQANSLDQLQPFLETYFFNPDFDLNQAEQFVIGNQKGSIIKLMILFQEMILNAVKYSSFIDRKRRFLKIRFEASGPDVSILVENPFDARTKVKTSGIGHVIIQNFAQLLDTTPIIKNDEGVYSVQIRFQNIWKGAVQ